jgi:Glycosyltransferase family 92
MSLTVCAIFRNESSYLREWIEFHRIVGFERFHLYQNRSDDDWQSVLRPYIDSGIVEVTDWPAQPPCQLQAYMDFIGRHAGERRWVAFIDCDEFLFSPCCATVGEALAQLSADDRGAIGVNWMCFGASGQDRQTDGLVTERFTWRPADEFGPNVHIKSIVRMDRVKSAGPDPHRFHVNGGTFSESGEQAPGPFTARPSHRLLRINHYLTKSRQEFLQKIARGMGDQPGQRAPSEFDGYQAADVQDRTIWKFLPELKRRLTRREIEFDLDLAKGG